MSSSLDSLLWQILRIRWKNHFFSKSCFGPWLIPVRKAKQTPIFLSHPNRFQMNRVRNQNRIQAWNCPSGCRYKYMSKCEKKLKNTNTSACDSKYYRMSWMWWHTLLVPVLRMQKQDVLLCEFKVSLAHIASSRPARPNSNNNKQIKLWNLDLFTLSWTEGIKDLNNGIQHIFQRLSWVDKEFKASLGHTVSLRTHSAT